LINGTRTRCRSRGKSTVGSLSMHGGGDNCHGATTTTTTTTTTNSHHRWWRVRMSFHTVAQLIAAEYPQMGNGSVCHVGHHHRVMLLLLQVVVVAVVVKVVGSGIRDDVIMSAHEALIPFSPLTLSCHSPPPPSTPPATCFAFLCVLGFI